MDYHFPVQHRRFSTSIIPGECIHLLHFHVFTWVRPPLNHSPNVSRREKEHAKATRRKGTGEQKRPIGPREAPRSLRCFSVAIDPESPKTILCLSEVKKIPFQIP